MNEYYYPSCQLRPGGLELTKKLLVRCDINSYCSILDIGCGRGESVEYIRWCCTPTVIGVDSNQRVLQEARSLYPECEYYYASAEKLPFVDQQFDYVLAECTLSLFTHPKTALTEVARILKDQSYLLISDIYAKSNTELSRAEGMLRNIYSKERYTSMLKNCGFRVTFFADESCYLKQLLGQMILDLGISAAWESIGINHCGIKGKNIGYMLMVAQKIGG
jgi:arsenite methyltransferase